MTSLIPNGPDPAKGGASAPPRLPERRAENATEPVKTAATAAASQQAVPPQTEVPSSSPDVAFSVMVPYADVKRMFSHADPVQAAHVADIQNQLRQGSFVIDPNKIAYGLAQLLAAQSALRG